MTTQFSQEKEFSNGTFNTLLTEGNDQGVKCVVWDLDNTLWQGTLAEGDTPRVSDDVMKIIQELDRRGILQSIASKNHYDGVKSQLQQFNLWQYFLYPQISWSPKSEAIKKIASELNLSLDAFAFIDDQEFELGEVNFTLPQVRCINAKLLPGVLQLACLTPAYITEESARRRRYYQSEQCRAVAEETFNGPSEAFLASLNMSVCISRATAQDLVRAEELTQRTHQLNTTGHIYSQLQLREFCQSDSHLLLVATLDDDFGSYGTIGLALIEKRHEFWQLNLFLMSCRVSSRGIGNVLLGAIMAMAKNAGVGLRAEFVANERNRLMYITYKFNGFSVLFEHDNHTLFEHNLLQLPVLPAFIKISTPDLKCIK